jgi:hypothetical protein
MNRAVGLLLVMMFAFVASGAAEWCHVRSEHSAAVALDAGHQDRGLHVQPASGHDDDCWTCLTLHAPVEAAPAFRLDTHADLLTRRVLLLQAQRLDASVPAARGCRSPPV